MSERLARKFHEAYERLAPQFGYETRKQTKNFDPESVNGRLMIAVCEEIKDDMAAAPRLYQELEKLTSVAMRFGIPTDRAEAALAAARGETDAT